MTVGQSDYTELKEQHYESILSMQSKIAGAALRKIAAKYGRKGTYLLIDATAGSGILEDGLHGSPLIASRVIPEASGEYGMNYQIMLIEKDRSTCGSLYTVIVPDENISIDHADYAEVLGAFSERKYQMGLLYVDANGIPNFDAIAGFAKKAPRVDILFSICANGYKRGYRGELNLSDQLARMGKSNWLVRRPWGNFQWTFFLGSNYIDKAYKRIELYPIGSDQGREWLLRMDLTADELKKTLQPVLIGLMPNI